MVGEAQHGESAFVASVHRLNNCFSVNKNVAKFFNFCPPPESEVAPSPLELRLYVAKLNHWLPLFSNIMRWPDIAYRGDLEAVGNLDHIFDTIYITCGLHYDYPWSTIKSC